MGSITTNFRRQYFGVAALCFLVSLLFILLLVLRIQTDEEFLKTLIEALIQLLGFGGIILAFLYPAQRSLIRNLRRRKRLWLHRLDQFNHNPKRYLKKGLPREYAEAAISLLDHEMKSTSQASHLGLLGFLAAFLTLGIDLLISTVHLGLYRQLGNFTIECMELGSVLVAIEIPLLVGGVTLLLYAVYRGSKLPEGLLE